MRILVTGAAGFIGYHLSLELSNRGYQVVALDALIESTYPAAIKEHRWQLLSRDPNIEKVHSDLRFDPLDEIINSVDVVINLAAMPGLMKSWSDIQLYSDCNFISVSRILDILIKCPGKRFVQVSTSSVYGLNAVGDESQPTLPISPYGVTKLAAEKLIHAYSYTNNIDFVILRYFSIYGPNQRSDMAYSIFIEKILKGDAIEIYGDGNQLRANTYVSDCVNGTIQAMENAQSKETYNICGGEEVSVLDAIRIISHKLGKTPKLEFKPKRPGDQLRTSGNWQKAYRDFKYEPKVDIVKGLELQINSFVEN